MLGNATLHFISAGADFPFEKCTHLDVTITKWFHMYRRIEAPGVYHYLPHSNFDHPQPKVTN